MPIKGYTDEAATFFGDGLPLIGKIHKGDEKGENRPGKDLNYFRVVFESQFDYLRDAWNDIYGPEPSEFSMVYLFGDELPEVFSSWKEEWGASETLYHRCDGERQAKKWSADLAEYISGVACESDHCKCAPVGRLDIVLRDFTEQTGVLGHFLVETHSMHDIIYIHGFLQHLKRTMNIESYRGLPFRFGRAPREISVPKQEKVKGVYRKTGEHIRKTMSLLYLLLQEDYMKVEYLPVVDARPRLPAQTIIRTEDEPVPDSSKIRSMLGGGGSRRLDSGFQKPAPDVEIIDDDPDVIDHEVSAEQPHMNKPGFDWSIVWAGVGGLFLDKQELYEAVQQMIDDQDLHAGMVEKAVLEAVLAKYAPKQEAI